MPPLHVATKASTYPITITIDDVPVASHVARLDKNTIVTFRKEVAKHQRQPPADEPEEQREARLQAAQSFTLDCIAKYVTVEPGQLTNDDGPVLTGAQLLDTFYNRLDVLDAFGVAVFVENCLGASEKKTLRARGSFSPGSKRSTKIPAGGAPESTVTSAAPPASVDDADATDRREPGPSGAKAT